MIWSVQCIRCCIITRHCHGWISHKSTMRRRRLRCDESMVSYFCTCTSLCTNSVQYLILQQKHWKTRIQHWVIYWVSSNRSDGMRSQTMLITKPSSLGTLNSWARTSIMTCSSGWTIMIKLYCTDHHTRHHQSPTSPISSINLLQANNKQIIMHSLKNWFFWSWLKFRKFGTIVSNQQLLLFHSSSIQFWSSLWKMSLFKKHCLIFDLRHSSVRQRRHADSVMHCTGLDVFMSNTLSSSSWVGSSLLFRDIHTHEWAYASIFLHLPKTRASHH